MNRTIKASLIYTAIIFAVGFVLGVLRHFLVIPLLGVRWAELLEMPFMMAASYFAARFIMRHWAPLSLCQGGVIGALSLLMMVGLELGLVLAQGIPLTPYIQSRDPVSGSAYLLALLVFAGLPAWIQTQEKHRG